METERGEAHEALMTSAKVLWLLQHWNRFFFVCFFNTPRAAECRISKRERLNAGFGGCIIGKRLASFRQDGGWGGGFILGL